MWSEGFWWSLLKESREALGSGWELRALSCLTQNGSKAWIRAQSLFRSWKSGLQWTKYKIANTSCLWKHANRHFYRNKFAACCNCWACGACSNFSWITTNLPRLRIRKHLLSVALLLLTTGEGFRWISLTLPSQAHRCSKWRISGQICLQLEFLLWSQNSGW